MVASVTVEAGWKRLPLRGAACLMLAALLISSCAQMQENPATSIGGLGGATAGGLIAAAVGANPAAIAGAVILGGLTGGLIGHLVDNHDKELAAKSAQNALETAPSGTTVAWKNPDNGHSGTVTPVKTYQNANGQYCREYTQTVTIEGKPEQSYGTACRQPDGAWKITS